MSKLQDDWAENASDTIQGKFENLFEDLVERFCDITGEFADSSYESSVDVAEEGLSVSINSLQRDRVLDTLEISIDLAAKKATIEKLIINQTGQGAGSFLAAEAIKILKSNGIPSFALNTDNMGSGFWSKLGFAPYFDSQNERRILQENFQLRLNVMKPYLPQVFYYVMKGKIANFDLNELARLRYEKEVVAMLDNPEFQQTFRTGDYAADPEGLTPDQDAIHRIVNEAEGDIKFAHLLCGRTNIDLQLNLRKQDQNRTFNAFREKADAAFSGGPGI